MLTSHKFRLENSTAHVAPVGSGSIARLFGGRFGARIALEAPNEGAGGGGEDEAAKAAAAAAAKAAADKAAADLAAGGEGKLSDREAELLKDVMSKKKRLDAVATELEQTRTRLKEFEGIDPVAVRALLASQKDAEMKAAEDKGDFERVKKMMGDEHALEIKKIIDAGVSKDGELAKALATINDLTIGASFASSSFVNDELVLPPAKARALYGDHFEIEGTKPVAYDKPKGHSERTKLVDAQGAALAFDAAIKKLIDADPDRERIVKSKLQSGAGSRTTDIKPGQGAQGDLSKLTGLARIQASLASGKAFGAKK